MKNITIFSLAISGVCVSTQVHAQSDVLQKYKQCVQERRSEIEAPQRVEAYKDRGCFSDQTNIWNERQSCSDVVCWESPPNNIIIDATVKSHSSNGSEHSFGETQYLPSRDAATKICNTVHARSPSGPHSGRGWQKLEAEVTLQRQITSAEYQKIEAECEKEVIG